MRKKIDLNLFILVQAKYMETLIKIIFQQKKSMMVEYQVFLIDLVMMKVKDQEKLSAICIKIIIN